MNLQKIFFSYSRTDGSDFALRLALDLKKAGFNVWIDQQDIRAGSEWDLEIEKALETCDCLLFVETEKSVVSNNVLDEVYYALEQRKKVIPLIVRDSKTPFRIQRLQHVDFTKRYEAGLTHLISELKEGVTPDEPRLQDRMAPEKIEKSFYAAHARLIIIAIVLLAVVAAAILYAISYKRTIINENTTIVSASDSISGDTGITGAEPNTHKNTAEIQHSGETKLKTGNKVQKANRSLNLVETFAGEWKLSDVEPKATSQNGYLKIERIDENKVKISSYVQFYYPKTNDTSYLSVFNGFAGCASCVLQEEMKITAEDIAIGSQTYKILKEDQPGGGKAGDTIMNAGANKSIRAAVSLHLVTSTTAIIKVQQTASIPLSYGLVLAPFVYTFRFSKVD